MRHILSIFFILVLLNSFAQTEKCKKDKNLTQMLYGLKTFDNIYTSNIDPFFQIDENLTDEKPIFSDERFENLEQTLKDEKTKDIIYKYKRTKEKKLKVYICNISVENNKLSISGFVKGSWRGSGNQMFVFAGTPKDTIRNLTLSPSPHGKVFYNGEEIKEPKVIRQYPSLTFKEYKVSKTEILDNNLKRGYFNITSEINDSTILVVSLDGRKAKIFDIGKLKRK